MVAGTTIKLFKVSLHNLRIPILFRIALYGFRKGGLAEMCIATARAYRSNFTCRIASERSRKNPDIKPFHGYWSTCAGKAHCIKDRGLLDDTCGRGGFLMSTKKQRGDME